MPRATILARLGQSLSWNLYVLRRGLSENHAAVRAAVRRDLQALFRLLRRPIAQ